MKVLKEAIRNYLTKLGYTCGISALTEVYFSLDNNRGRFSIKSANPKRLEVEVSSEISDFKIPYLQGEINGHGYQLKRFPKSSDSVPHIVDWVARALISHSHLLELLTPQAELPEPFGFAAGTYMTEGDTTYPGVLERVGVEDIVSVDNRMVSHTAFDPTRHVYFLVRCSLRSHPVRDNGKSRYMHAGSIEVVTDGDIWYPYNDATGRIFLDADKIERLKYLNQNDKALLRAALTNYAGKFTGNGNPEEA